MKFSRHKQIDIVIVESKASRGRGRREWPGGGWAVGIWQGFVDPVELSIGGERVFVRDFFLR